jgi:tRNA U34 5-methylaminomethyl-2-thiouridine-forming methyltransferase MnmC
MEHEHLATNAAVAYRDPGGQADRSTILRLRQEAQQSALALGTVESTSRWRRRWGLERSGGIDQGNHQ